MIRDPFYRDIVKGLAGKLDPEVFEQCATDILRAIYPALVPIRGGSDAGMDGAIGDTEGIAYPLIATTGRDVIGNLTKSLRSYLRNGAPRRQVVLATSQSLTPKKRRNLERRAGELGFTLVQTHSQEAIANLLYRDPSWCKELLSLTGQPPALSVVPLTSRPQIIELLIGREDDLAWLENTNGDLLLVGQPGSGKTFLMQTFAKQNEGLFLINDDPIQIAASVREQDPKAIIVDDAHTDPNRLRKLHQLREQIGAGFRIIATCWPGEKDNSLHLMQLPSSSTLELDLLILATVTFPIFGRTKDAFTEQPIAFGPVGAIVDSLGLLNLTVRPRTNSLWRSQSYCNCFKGGTGFRQLSSLQATDRITNVGAGDQQHKIYSGLLSQASPVAT